MAKGRPKGSGPEKAVSSFRFSKETFSRLDEMLVNPPDMLFDGFRGYPRSRTELLELLVYLASEQRLQIVEPPIVFVAHSYYHS